MSQYPARPVRLADLPSEQDLLGVSPLVHAATAPLPEIAPDARQRIRGRLYGSLAGRGHVFHHRWRQALILASTLAIGGVVGAATHSAIVKRISAKKVAATEQARELGSSRRIATRSTGSAPTPVATPTEQEPQPVPRLGQPPAETSPRETSRRPTSPGLNRDLPRPISAPPSSPRVSAPPAESLSPPTARQDWIPPQTEATALAEAIRKLRVDGDAATALRLLDERHNLFAEGALGREASAVRIEALLKLGQTDAALSDLERPPINTMPRRDEWHVVRGELRAQVGRWSSAEADFTLVLTGRLRAADGDLAERALWGRAAVRSHQGDVAGARADSAEYLRRFPGGRFASQASHALLAPSSP